MLIDFEDSELLLQQMSWKQPCQVHVHKLIDFGIANLHLTIYYWRGSFSFKIDWIQNTNHGLLSPFTTRFIACDDSFIFVDERLRCSWYSHLQRFAKVRISTAFKECCLSWFWRFRIASSANVLMAVWSAEENETLGHGFEARGTTT